MRRNSSFQSGQDDSQEGQIDLTPMLDVVFIMLIFFIVTASFIKEAGIEVVRPEAITANQKKNAKILVAINDNNEVWIDKRAVDPRSVKVTIERMLAENPKGGLVVQADAGSNAKTVASVLDAARDAGVTDVAISTEKL
jgi:biopolymer transport protein ExbD